MSAKDKGTELKTLLDELNGKIKDQLRAYKAQLKKEEARYTRQLKKEHPKKAEWEIADDVREKTNEFYTKRILPLENATTQVDTLKRSIFPGNFDLGQQISHAKDIMENLDNTTKKLPTSNPLKAFINKIFKSEIFKTQAHEISQKGKAMLTKFEDSIKPSKQAPQKPPKPETPEPDKGSKSRPSM